MDAPAPLPPRDPRQVIVWRRRWVVAAAVSVLGIAAVLSLGLIVLSRRAADFRRVGLIVDYGGTVGFHTIGPAWLPHVVGWRLGDGLNRIDSVDFRAINPEVDIDSFLSIPIPEVEEIWLDGTRATDAGLLHLRPLKGLKHLHVHGSRVTDDGIAELQRALPGLVIDRRPIADSDQPWWRNKQKRQAGP
ncbi:MAG: hypothetical protein ACM3U2_15115 [Deltaproteobacteria bacterium]